MLTTGIVLLAAFNRDPKNGQEQWNCKSSTCFHVTAVQNTGENQWKKQLLFSVIRSVAANEFKTVHIVLPLSLTFFLKFHLISSYEVLYTQISGTQLILEPKYLIIMPKISSIPSYQRSVWNEGFISSLQGKNKLVLTFPKINEHIYTTTCHRALYCSQWYSTSIWSHWKQSFGVLEQGVALMKLNFISPLQLSVEQDAVVAWIRVNKLSLNPGKTEVLWLGSSCFWEIGQLSVLDWVALLQKEQVCSLGVFFDPSLSLEAQMTSDDYRVLPPCKYDPASATHGLE